MTVKQQKHIAIFGSYNRRSIGDTAILLGLLSSLKRIYGNNLNITLLLMDHFDIYQQSSSFGIGDNFKTVCVKPSFAEASVFALINVFIVKLGSKLFNRSFLEKRKIAKVLSECDILLIGGGNLLMDLYQRWPRILEEICFISKKSGTPYYMVGVGASPIMNNKGKKILENCLRFSSGVYFRDNFSKDYCSQKLDFNDGDIGPDLALGIKYDPKNISIENKYKSIMINLCSIYSDIWPEKDPIKFEKYITGMTRFVEDICLQKKPSRLIVFNTNYPLDDLAAKKFIHKIKQSDILCDIEYLNGRRTVKEIIDKCAGAHFAITTRLHAGILAHIAGCEVLAMVYQPKVRCVLYEMGITNKFLNIHDLTDEKWIDEAFIELLNKKNKCKSVSYDKVDDLVKNVVG